MQISAYQRMVAPTTWFFILSSISLCYFYSTYVPWFDSNIKPLRRSQCLYYNQSLPLFTWSPTLIYLFKNCKTNLITSSLSLPYDSLKPTSLK